MGFMDFLERFGVVEEKKPGGGHGGSAQDPDIRDPEAARDLESPRSAHPPAPVQPSAPGKDRELDSSLREQLELAVQGSGQEPYGEFLDVLSTLSETIPDEASRYRTAIKLMAKKGHPAPSLLAGLDARVGVLEEKGRDFSRELDEQVRVRVSARSESAERLGAEIRGIREQIDALERQINELEARRQADLSAASSEKSGLEHLEVRFRAVYASVSEDMAAVRRKIAEYGKEH